MASMDSMVAVNADDQADVVIVGAGPCGVTLANYLGTYGVSCLLVERSPEVLDYPRAVGADDEALRSWQGVGLAEAALRDMVQNAPARYYNSRGRCFAEVGPREQPFGWPRRNVFIQPLTETTLRAGLTRFPNVRFETGLEVTGVRQDDSGVTLSARAADGAERTLRARYAVGADGGRSTVREAVGVALGGLTHANKWLVIDVMDDPLFSPCSAVHCDPVRPNMSIHLPYGYRRLEFQLLPGETDEQVLEPAFLARLMRRHYPAGVTLPPIKRARIYLHHSRIAEKFQAGRVFLAGDAAHLQPPFFGQGMNSGLRDATNLAWKLAWVLRHGAHPRTLESYGSERREHALAMVNFVTWLGGFYKPWSRLTERVRDGFFAALRFLPGAREYILGLKFKPMSFYRQGVVLQDAALLARQNNPVGRMFMQPLLEFEGKAMRLDDLIGPRFALIGLRLDPWSLLSGAQRAALASLQCQPLCVLPSRAAARPAPAAPTLVAEDLQGRLRDWETGAPQWPCILLRPDRYVAAVCSAAELPATINRFIGIMKEGTA